ncbi:unnamed protein product [Vitrella brassicaformis CCMP3155]|uniref:Helicase ATP-binding domain-containing protein n=3 Tax=Vitrella brassicaformis TaxID=1169539 RepID=A0A0G4ELY9_VITBC|nr:unnamed protein product [Vitrella brassicaformis CCMP3155]|eukprot:CEL98142.1 unnamed protein product [Vitrella brassicaformis CCMP3155]
MPVVDIGGYAVDFPFEPYDCQKIYMAHVIRALSTGQHALLESPTGTGKTLCLLCATLAYRARLLKDGPAQPGGVPRVIYSSRTHSQLRHVIRELKRTNYVTGPGPVTKVCILASRDHLCVNARINRRRGQELNAACQNMLAKQLCHYHGGLSVLGKSVFDVPRDIEDWVSFSNDPQPEVDKPFCPFFATRENQKICDLVFCPYNYILNPEARKTLKLDLTNAIVILDEGHNVEKVCEEAASFDLRGADLCGAVKDIDAAMPLLAKKVPASVSEPDPPSERPKGKGSGDKPGRDDDRVRKVEGMVQLLMEARGALLAVERKLLNVELKDGDDICPARHMLSDGNGTRAIFNDGGLDRVDVGELRKASDAVLEVLSDTSSSGASESSSTTTQKGIHLDKCTKAIQLVYSDHVSGNVQSFRTLVRENTNGILGASNTRERCLSFWCCSAAVAMGDMMGQGVRNLIITSGTLSPLDALAAQLGPKPNDVKFGVRLENAHVVGASQLTCGILKRGPIGPNLNFNKDHRDNSEMLQGFGRGVVQVCRKVPDGVLLVFPSYALMDNVINKWESGGIMAQIRAHKEVFIEPHKQRGDPSSASGTQRNKRPTPADDFGIDQDMFTGRSGPTNVETVMSSYARSCQESLLASRHHQQQQQGGMNGAILFAVCRGKISEGIDLNDHLCRAVILCGIPYPTPDERVKLKRQYLNRDRRNPDANEGPGRTWYEQQACRAINQAIGRVIRHQKDFGIILLCDERFGHGGVQSQLSQWLRPHVKTFDTFGPAISSLAKFFQDIPPALTDACYNKVAAAQGGGGARHVAVAGGRGVGHSASSSGAFQFNKSSNASAASARHQQQARPVARHDSQGGASQGRSAFDERYRVQSGWRGKATQPEPEPVSQPSLLRLLSKK